VSAREDVLSRISTALRDRPTAPPIARTYHQRNATAGIDLVDLFTERALDYAAVLRRCDASTLIATIESVLAAHGARRVVAPSGLPREWLPTAMRDEPAISVAELDQVDGVLTSCAVAIALTGTVVLDHGPGQGRRALTLIPDLHVLVVRAGQIVHGVPDALALLDPTRATTWISGPSATSDIELTRVEGVHGPRRLEVIVCTTDTAATTKGTLS